MARADTQRAIVLATAGIALMLLLCFPRPLLGLLALLPAAAGLAMALLVHALFRPTISALALGFGGAIISITVDHGIAYLLLLDRRRNADGSAADPVSGRAAARDIWSVGLFATLTTVGGFAALGLSGFAILEQVGLLASLGIGFSFLFVHAVFPLVFPRLPAARRGPLIPVDRLLTAATAGRTFRGALVAVAVLAVLLPFARPRYAVDLSALNSVRPATLAAERRLGETWRGFFDRVMVLADAPDADALRRETDRAARFVEDELRRGSIAQGIAPSSLAPGPERARRNRAAWARFWDPARRARLRAALERAADELGFSEGAFEPFLATAASPGHGPVPLPAALHDLLGVSVTSDGWSWLGSFARGQAYRPDAFAARASAAGLHVFDPGRFTARLSQHLSSTFLRMLGVVALAVFALLVVLFADLTLVALSLTPLLFALGGTLGALGLLGHPIDIPGLMLVIVIFGMGIDYALYMVRSQQRFLTQDHPAMGPIRLAALLAGASTLVGMGSLLTAQHAVPRSAGITASLGIGFALAGAFLILPPFLRRILAPPGDGPGTGPLPRRVRRRYRHLDASARMHARFKMLLDPMFPALTEKVGPARRILDVGCGLGVPAAWLLEANPGARLWAVEPREEHARLAAHVLAPRGEVLCAAAPALPAGATDLDAALLLDVAHHLSDEDLGRLLRELRARLRPGGRLVLRATVPMGKRFPWERRLEALHGRLRGQKAHFRTAQALCEHLDAAGFGQVTREGTAGNREETWFVGTLEGDGT